MALSELGRCKMRNLVDQRMINFGANLQTSDRENKISYGLLQFITNNRTEYTSRWLTHIQTSLRSSGLGYLATADLSMFAQSEMKHKVKTRLTDIEIQSWHDEMYNSRHCVNYRMFKSELRLENYLIKLNSRKLISLCKFRCGNHKLPSTAGRFLGIPRAERLCTLCESKDIGDEFHYLFRIHIRESQVY